jgi:glycerol-3-phosphate acyltransferase PlsY
MIPLDPSLALSGAVALAIGYLLGSIPFGFLLTRLSGTGDIRAIGSGNIGATNVLRTGRKGLAAATLVGDALKGMAAVLIVSYLDRQHPQVADLALLAGLGAFLGHLFPVWLRFKGGKGVATYIGVLLAVAWPAAIGFCLIWLAVAALTRYSSLSGLVASAFTPALLWLLDLPHAAALFVLLTALIWITHRANIARLLDGSEGKIGKAKEIGKATVGEAGQPGG